MAVKVEKLKSETKKLMKSQVRTYKKYKIKLDGQKWLFGWAKTRQLF